MKITHGKVLIFFGLMHTLLGISPFAFGKQFYNFSDKFFFKISEGLIEFPLLNGTMNYENFAAFWFVYYGLLLITLGILTHEYENKIGSIPSKFIYSYLSIVLIGVYMIPFSGMSLLMLPQALYMWYTRSNKTEQ